MAPHAQRRLRRLLKRGQYLVLGKWAGAGLVVIVGSVAVVMTGAVVVIGVVACLVVGARFVAFGLG